MSGPKVVRIVTIEEVQETCRGALAQLDASLARWEKVCERNDLASETEVSAMRERARQIAALFEAERYLDLQKQVPEEITWLEADLELRFEAAAERAKAERTRAHRRKALAEDLLARVGEIDIAEDVKRSLEDIARGRKLAPTDAEAVLSLALRQTSSRTVAEGISEEQSMLAGRLFEGLDSQSLEDWLATQGIPLAMGEQLDEEIAAALSELRRAGSDAIADEFAAKWQTVDPGLADATRRMRADTLLLEISRATAKRRDGLKALGRLEALHAEALRFGKYEASQLANKVGGTITNDDADAARELATHLETFIHTERSEQAAVHRRSAVLTALSQAGYEVREGMQTLTPQDGKLVLRRAANPEMGVEVVAGTAGDRVQLRPVRFASTVSASDTSRDRDIETIWCGDFDRLRAGLAEAGSHLTIERALPVGSTPVAVIETESATDARSASSAAPLQHKQTR